jgi:hypothetical protein
VPGYLVGAVGTFVVSLFVAYWFLRLRCRGIGPPFGRRARPWALLIVVGTAVVSAGVGLLIVGASDHVHAAYTGVLVPVGLWFPKMPPQDLTPRTLGAWLALPFSRLYDRMGEDMQAWCDTRIRAAKPKPQWVADAVTYYYDQVRGRLKDRRSLAQLGDWQESITHKVGIARLILLDTTPARLREAMQNHPSTQKRTGNYTADELLEMARRLESDALNELSLFLVYIYHLGYYDLLIYPFRPGAQRAQPRRAEPTGRDR